MDGGGAGSPGGKDERGQSGQPDMFADYRNMEDTNNPAVICLLACMCITTSLYIAFIIWAIVTIAGSESARGTDCGTIYDLWMFNAVALLGGTLMALQGVFRQPVLGFFGAIIFLILAIWGFLMWFRMSDACDLWFSHNYFDLFLLFKINTIFYCVFFCCSCFVLCGTAMGLAGGVGGQGGYFSDIPGANYPGENLEEELRKASGDGRVPDVERLLYSKADPNAADDNGWAALHHAANYGRDQVAQRLVNSRANIDAENKNGDTPLRLATGKGEVETLLRQMGAREFNPSGGGAAATMDYV